MRQAMAQAKAEALCANLQNGKDNLEEVRKFLALGTAVPDALVLASLGNRARDAKACPKSLKALLEGRANPDAIDQLTQGAVIHSACYHGSVEVLRILLDFRADPEAKEPRMNTPPLNTALAAGNAPACLELLNRNVDVNWTHHDGATALHVATAWIASAHNSHLRLPPVGEEPRAVIAMMLHNGVDPTKTEGMSKGANRATGMTPLESFRREIARSPWRTDEKMGVKFDKTAKVIHMLLEQGESAVKQKNIGNTAFKEKRNQDAIKAWAEARDTWTTAGIRGHHMAVLWNNEALCYRNMADHEKAQHACKEGLSHYTTPQIRAKLEFNLAEAEKPVPQKTEEDLKKEEAHKEIVKEKIQKHKEEIKEISKKSVESGGGIYGEGGSAEKSYVMPGPFICPMNEAQEMGLGPPPAPKPWWEKKEADSDEEPERTTITYLPAHHPKW